MELKKCGVADLEDLVSIGRKTYYDTFHSMNTEETMTAYLDEAFDVGRITEELNNPKSEFYFLYDDGVRAGYFKVNFYPAQSDINDPDSLELERIYVDAANKGRGYGRFMIDSAVSIAKAGGCGRIWLGVWEHNHNAISFYKKMGFEIVDTHSFRMGDELQNDYILSKPV